MEAEAGVSCPSEGETAARGHNVGVFDREWTFWWRWTGWTELSRLLWERWDPIGFAHEDGRGYKPPEDEYDSYVDRVGDLLRRGADAGEIRSHLEQIENDSIRLGPADERSDVASEIVAWYQEAQLRRRS